MTETFHVQTMKKCLEQKELVRAFISPKLIFFSFFDFPFPCVRVCLEQEGGGVAVGVYWLKSQFQTYEMYFNILFLSVKCCLNFHLNR